MDASADVYNQVVRRMENEQLHRAIDRLNDEEKHMIYELFFREKKLTRLAEESGVSWQTVQEKRDNILRKLKRIFMQYAEKI